MTLPLRQLPPLHNGLGRAFAALNAGKRSMVVDLKKPEGVDLVMDMVGQVVAGKGPQA